MTIIKYKKIFFIVTAIFIVAAIASISFFGLSVSIDFTGGSIFEINYSAERPTKAALEERLSGEGINGFSVRPLGDRGFIIRTPEAGDDERAKVASAISWESYESSIDRFSSIGPTVGSELKTKALIAIIVVLLIIIFYIAYTFRKVGGEKDSVSARTEVETLPSSLKYGLTAIITLGHDIIVPAGAFAVYGYFTGAQADVLFVMALLAILGYSVNDTIVIFDRVRENLLNNKKDNHKETFDETVGKSLSQTYARSINTSLTTLFVLITLFFIGSETTAAFAFTLLVGVIAGSYSSICFAAPLLTSFAKKTHN
ncbi:MAG: protein translocase subunit SecF [bacterium]|nr:protein translocase subunit SecF [bacterium]